ncbi:Uncharacterised protein [Trueperella pyogenes]|uniref:hypothetical protein n=1 Tax=Trueperella pyogenes TaxID=1661 RepID=UPI000E07F671|nr:hypothetical protein [Trueperella pyogenes]MBB3025401.1 hypothetical protein [Trueperella pyogenes]SUO87750.1 Uncharacterised protein [Trueperella pyogenes]
MRRPGQRRSASAVIARATLGAGGLVAALVGVACLIFPNLSWSILAGGAIGVALNLMTLAAMAITYRFFADAMSAALVGAYVAKLLVFAALIFALKNSALDLRVVVSVVIFSLVVSLAVYTTVSVKKSGPYVGDRH